MCHSARSGTSNRDSSSTSARCTAKPRPGSANAWPNAVRSRGSWTGPWNRKPPCSWESRKPRRECCWATGRSPAKTRATWRLACGRPWTALARRAGSCTTSAPPSVALVSRRFRILDYRSDGRRRGFPFDPYLLYLHRRLLRADEAADRLLGQIPAAMVPSVLRNFQGLLAAYRQDTEIRAAADFYERACTLFTRLREALRLSATDMDCMRQPQELPPEQEHRLSRVSARREPGVTADETGRGQPRCRQSGRLATPAPPASSGRPSPESSPRRRLPGRSPRRFCPLLPCRRIARGLTASGPSTCCANRIPEQ